MVLLWSYDCTKCSQKIVSPLRLKTTYLIWMQSCYIFVASYSQDLNKLAAIVRGELTKLDRAVLGALITLDVHARDMVTGMVKSQVTSTVLRR